MSTPPSAPSVPAPSVPADADALIAAIEHHNRGRDPALLALKYRKMARSGFLFLRGADHLFYDALPGAAALCGAPPAWCCGDLHVENFGSYQGDDRQVYFDINDFDEAALAPAHWDLLRLLASILCGADALRLPADEAQALSRQCLLAYRAALAGGKPLRVERDSSAGMVKHLLDSLRRRDRARFLDQYTERHGHRRGLRPVRDKLLAATPGQVAAVTACVDAFAAGQPAPGFFSVLDVARRVAGTGSVGLPRFVVLVEGKGAPDGNHLLDLKLAQASTLLPRLAALGVAQPGWPDEAARVCAVQQRMQAVAHAFLHAVVLEGRAFLLRELQPSEDRIDLADSDDKQDKQDRQDRQESLGQVFDTMGRVLAWDQLRAAGHHGAAGAGQLAAFAQRGDWPPALLDAAGAMAALTRAQWQACRDWLGAH